MRRRALLSTLAVSTAGLGSCLGVPLGPRSSADSTPLPTDPLAGPVQCRGPPVTAERSVADEPGYGDDIEYFSENGTVRFVSVRGGDENRYGEWSLDEWAGIECARAGLGRVREATAERLGSDEFGSGVGAPPEGSSYDGFVITLFLTTWVSRDDTTTTPTIRFPRLVEVAPRVVESTVSLDGDSVSRAVPVFAEHARGGAA